jgi:hypothetical protein
MFAAVPVATVAAGAVRFVGVPSGVSRLRAGHPQRDQQAE